MRIGGSSISSGRSSRRAPRAWRGFWAPLLAAVLLLAGLDLHPVGEVHGPLALTGGATYFPEAAHPTLPQHFEQAHAAERPHCAACFHRLGNHGVQTLAAVALAPPLPRATVPAGADPTLRLRPLRPGGARAPPLS